MLITIGRIIKPWGVKGEVQIEPMTDFPERFKRVRRLYLVSPAGREIVCELQSVRYAGSAIFLHLLGYNSPEHAKDFNGWFIKIPEAETLPLSEGSYYWFELIGMEVVTEKGDTLGTIVDIFETGSNDVYVMKRGRKEVYIPAIKEVVRHVDVKARRMVIHLVDGLLD
ncbi:MAG TPA: ribosome maturation factor RimM [Nitrospirota bacterium]|nr:ribosome maturation factor RimM [Nitrospirota bacterium]